MKFNELKNKSVNDLQKGLAEMREQLRELRFKVSSDQVKNIRQIREIKKNIAQTLMLLRSKNEQKETPKS
jgi:large subunit ribosomal protein L29